MSLVATVLYVLSLLTILENFRRNQNTDEDMEVGKTGLGFFVLALVLFIGGTLMWIGGLFSGPLFSIWNIIPAILVAPILYGLLDRFVVLVVGTGLRALFGQSSS